MGRGGALGVDCVVPSVAVASHGGGIAHGAAVDGQVEGYHTVATSGVDEGVEVEATFGVGLASEGPCVAIAGGFGHFGLGGSEDGEVEGNHAVATGSGGQTIDKRIDAHGGRHIDVFVAQPRVVATLAVRGFFGQAVDGVDGEVERDGAVAAKHVLEGGTEEASGGVVGVVECVGLAKADLAADGVELREVLLRGGYLEEVFERQAGNVGGAEADEEFVATRAGKRGGGAEFVANHLEEGVVVVAKTFDQGVDEGQVDIVIDGREGGHDRTHGGILGKEGVGEENLGGSGVVVHHHVGGRFEGFDVAHIIDSLAHKFVELAIVEGKRSRRVGVVEASQLVGAFVFGDEELDLAHSGTAFIVGGSKTKGAVERVLSVHLVQ